MKWDTIKNLVDEDFRRLTGVKKTTFLKMIEVLREVHQQKKLRGGRQNKLCIEDRLLMTLEYLREYRTYFHISKSYGLSESNTYKTIRSVEDILIKSKIFNLPGRKALLKSDIEYSVVLVDASETPIQRPKKNNITFIQERRNGIH